MASTNKCEYCGSTITSNDQKCPNCGATNPVYVEDTPRVILAPHTIEELQEYCAERGMPLLRMRFFIGEDFREPKAFGIYREPDGKVIVYKNKDNGQRAIRYEGYDEAKGVNELYLKLLSECHNRGIYPDTPDGKPPKDVPIRVTPKSGKSGCLGFVIIALIIIVAVLISDFKHPTGYYNYKGTPYYHIGNDWYYYSDSYDDWYSSYDTEVNDILHDGERTYYVDDWQEEWGDTGYDFKMSDAYSDYQEAHSSSSSDSSYDSWDSGSTDWGSDW